VTVSVIIPNYNKDKTLRACLSAVYRQTSPPTEVIVVDDASTDGSRAIAREFPCVLVEQPVNLGVSAARNAGARAASGDVLFFVDSDIALAPDAIATALRILDDHPEFGVVQGIYDIQPLYRDSLLEEYKTLFEHYWRARAAGIAVTTLFSLTAVPRKVFDEVGGFEERLRDGEDNEFGMRLPDRYQIWMSDRVLGRHDDVDRFRPYLAEHLRRAVTFGTLLRRPDATAFNRGSRDHATAIAMICCAGTVFTAPLPLLAGWWTTTVPLGLFLLYLWVDRAVLGFALRRRGPLFALYFTGMHALMHATQLCGMAIGVLWGGRR
jgi:glycosyltransferase involved in cell wall biosynthesis